MKKILRKLNYVWLGFILGFSCSSNAIPFSFYPGPCVPSGAYSARLQYGLRYNGMRIYIPPQLSRITLGYQGNLYTFELATELQWAIQQWQNRIPSALLPSMSIVSQPNQANVFVSRPENRGQISYGTVRTMLGGVSPFQGFADGQQPISDADHNFGHIYLLNNSAEINDEFIYQYNVARRNLIDNDTVDAQRFAQLFMHYFALNTITHLLGFATTDGQGWMSAMFVKIGDYDEHSDPVTTIRELRVYLVRWLLTHERTFSGVDKIEINPKEIDAYMTVNNGFSSLSALGHEVADNGSQQPVCRPLRNLSYGDSNEITTPHIFTDYAPTWIDLYDRGTKDYCSVTSTGVIRCYKNNNGDFNEQVLFDNTLSDSGWANTEVFMKAGYQRDPSDGKSYPVIGFCRLVGSWTHLYCNFYVADKRGKFTRSTAGGDYGYLDGGWSDNPAFAGENKISDTRWWINLNGKGQSYCRLVGHTNMACRAFEGLQAGLATSDIESENINDTVGDSYTRGWISNWHGDPAYCRIAGSPSYIYCLPFDRKTMRFGKDVQVKGFNDYYSNNTIKWVDNFTLDGGSALCYLKHTSSGYWVNCLTANSNFSKSIRFPAVNDSGWDDAFGLLSFPGVVGTKGWCGLTGSWTHIQCQLFDNIYTPSGLQNRFVSATSGYVDGGYPSIWNGNREWMNYLDQNALFCRKVNGYDMRCTRIYYQ